MQASKFFLVALITACSSSVDGPGNNGKTDAGPGGGDGNQNTDGCPEEAKSVYVVDQNNTLSRFDPPTKNFVDLGKLNCPAKALATPFSMGIDRTATAYVLYDSGELFNVNTSSLACTKVGWTTQQGLLKFGMGFSTEAAGSSVDTLFISGGNSPNDATSKLAKLPISNYQPQMLGTVQGWPELSGTGNGELWGFFPDVTAPRIAKLDKSNGNALTTHPLAIAGEPTAWAFAVWGGDFYVFLMKDDEESTTIYQYGANGMEKSKKLASGRTIVGAGVSTCAPVIL